jgi:hypothetical protein
MDLGFDDAGALPQSSYDGGSQDGGFGDSPDGGRQEDGTLAEGATANGELLNIDFGVNNSTPSTKVGPAAIGLGPNDVWNSATGVFHGANIVAPTVVPGLKWSNGQNAGVTASIDGLAGAWSAPTSPDDPMLKNFSYGNSNPSGIDYQGTGAVTLLGLPPGVYTFYLYGKAAANDNSGFFITVHADQTSPALTTSATKFTSVTPFAATFVEDNQYVRLDTIAVGGGQVVTVHVLEDQVHHYGKINGLQLRRQ